MKWFRRPLHRWSISMRLTLWYVTTLLVVLGLFAAFSYAAFHTWPGIGILIST